MIMKHPKIRLGCLILSFSLIFPALASAQQAVGIVTALKGKAQLTRAATQTALRFKDDLILRDIIDTQEKSLTRVLFGGKSTVTVRELSRLEVREELIPGGGTRSIHELSSGSILVNVARSLLRRGDEVQIRTPNAVAAVRGSAVFALYNAALAQSIFAVLTGSAVVTPQGLPPITLAPLGSANVTGSATAGVQTTEGTITQAEANEIVEGSDVGTGGRTEESAEAGVQEAAQLTDAVLGGAVGGPVDQEPVVVVQPPSICELCEKIEEEATTAQVLPFTFKTNTTSSDTPFIQVTNETVDKTVDLITVSSGLTVTLDGKLLAIDPSTVTTTGAFLSITNASLTIGGSLLTSENSTLTADTLLDISSGSTVTNTAGPVIKITGGSLTADSLLDADDSGNTFNFTGTIVDLKDTTVTLRILEDDPVTLDEDDFTLTLAANEPVVRLNNSTLKITGTTNNDSLIDIDAADFSGATTPGVYLIATNNSTITNEGGGLLEMTGVFSTTSTEPLVQITNSTVTASSDTSFELFTVKAPSSGSTNITMSGPLASIASTVTTDGDFFRITGGAKITSSTTDPFIKSTDATVTVGSGSTDSHFFRVDAGGTQFTTTSSAPLVQLSNTTLDRGGSTNLRLFEVTGTGTSFQPIKGSEASFTVNSTTASNPIGALFKATNASEITVNTALKLDSALFEATLPVFELVGTSTTQTQITSTNAFAEISSAKAVLTGPFIALDKGLITVNDGPLISISSTMDVSGDLLKLISGSTINVVNGPLIKVDGSGSSLNVTGALVNFGPGGTGGSTIIVRNGLCSSSCSSTSGVNFFTQTGGSVSISGTPIKNSSLGSIDQGSTDAVIQAVSGTVTIQGN